MRARAVGTGLWLVAVAAGQLAALELVRRFFVGTARGQLLDTAALEGNAIGRSHVDGLVDTVLSAMTVASLFAATLVIGFIALLRGRVMLAAAATLMIVGANLTTQLLKTQVDRPDYGVDLERAAAGNSLPSGHGTVAASVAIALVLVLPSGLRGLAAVVGAGYATLAGVATMSAGWHRPSDAVAALLVVGAWAAVAGLLLVVAGRGDDAGQPTMAGRPHRVAMWLLGIVGVASLAAAAVAMMVTDGALAEPVDALGRSRLLTAYAGGAAGIAGVACLVTAGMLATVHLVVPDRAGTGRPHDLARSPSRAHAG